MPISAAIRDAVERLSRLEPGQHVLLTEDGRTHEMYVSRTIRRSDGSFGSYESSRVTVTFGPGRYATEIYAERVAEGKQTFEALGTHSTMGTQL